MQIFTKIVLLLSPLFCYGAPSPSFSFSKEEGLKQISSSETNSKNTSADSVETNETAPDNETAPTESSASQKQPEELKTHSISESSASQNKQPEELETHSISEDFAPQEPEYVEGASFLDTLIEDSSWFFQKKHSRHKIGITPNYKHDSAEGHGIGLSLFFYSPKEKGYYLNSTFNKYLFKPYFRFKLSFIGNREGVFRSKGNFVYNNHYENFYGDTKSPQAMQAKLSDSTRIYSTRFIINYDLSYQERDQDFYFGLGARIFGRKERKNLQNNREYFEKDFFLFLRAFAGFDTRDNVRDPKKGAFHQVSFGCKANLSYSASHCQGDGDLRFYFPLFKETEFIPFKNSILALRAFFGSSFLSSDYATKYSLGRHSFFQNINTLRGFTRNRFIGDKIYLAQTELRWPIWDKYLQGVFFLEMGETAELNQSFKDFVFDYGGGLRFGLPPKYDLKLRLDWGTGRDLQGARNYDFTISFLQVF